MYLLISKQPDRQTSNLTFISWHVSTLLEVRLTCNILTSSLCFSPEGEYFLQTLTLPHSSSPVFSKRIRYPLLVHGVLWLLPMGHRLIDLCRWPEWLSFLGPMGLDTDGSWLTTTLRALHTQQRETCSQGSCEKGPCLPCSSIRKGRLLLWNTWRGPISSSLGTEDSDAIFALSLCLAPAHQYLPEWSLYLCLAL